MTSAYNRLHQLSFCLQPILNRLFNNFTKLYQFYLKYEGKGRGNSQIDPPEKTIFEKPTLTRIRSYTNKNCVFQDIFIFIKRFTLVFLTSTKEYVSHLHIKGRVERNDILIQYQNQNYRIYSMVLFLNLRSGRYTDENVNVRQTKFPLDYNIDISTVYNNFQNLF